MTFGHPVGSDSMVVEQLLTLLDRIRPQLPTTRQREDLDRNLEAIRRLRTIWQGAQ